MFDVIVIGGGIIGGAILRELTKYRLSVCLLEKENDVCMGQSKANSGIVHAGFDAPSGSLKAKFNVLGCAMMPEFARELGVKYVNNGALVLAFNEEDLAVLRTLYDRGEVNGVSDLEIIDKNELLQVEPNVYKTAVAALRAKSAGIVCPYTLTIACVGNAMDNGADLKTNFEVVAIRKERGVFTVESANGELCQGKIVINCAGLAGAKIASMIGDKFFTIGARKGEYILLDRSANGYVSHTIFRTPTNKGKGVLVTPTVDGNVLFGPTSREMEREDTSTTREDLTFIQESAKATVENPPFSQTITSFTGVRAYSNTHDFIIEESKTCSGFIHVVGIESPGLTSAPAIAKYVVEELVSDYVDLVVNETFNGYRSPDYFFKDLTIEQQNEWIAKNPTYGNIVCRCEGITEGEIIRAMHVNPPAKDLDGIKRRTRAGMGRCQGGFCQPNVLERIAKEWGLPMEEVTKQGKRSKVLLGVTK